MRPLADKQNFVNLDLQDARRQSREAKRETVQLKAQLDQVRKLTGAQALSSVSEVLSNGLVQRLKEQLIDLKNQRVELLKKYLDKHPDVLVVDAKIKRVEKSLQSEVKGIRQAIDRKYRASLASEAKLCAEVVSLRIMPNLFRPMNWNTDGDKLRSNRKKHCMYRCLGGSRKRNFKLRRVRITYAYSMLRWCPSGPSGRDCS